MTANLPCDPTCTRATPIEMNASRYYSSASASLANTPCRVCGIPQNCAVEFGHFADARIAVVKVEAGLRPRILAQRKSKL